MISLQKTLSGSKPSSSVAGERGEQSRACAAGWAPRGGLHPEERLRRAAQPRWKSPWSPVTVPLPGARPRSAPFTNLYKSHLAMLTK